MAVRTYRDASNSIYRMEFRTEAEATAYRPPADRTLIADIPEPPPKTTAELDQDSLNEALVTQGSVVRALALITFQEVNKLRVKDGDPAYTLAQFKTALLAQMR